MTIQLPARAATRAPARGALVRTLRRIPAAARWCALVAFLNAAVWVFVTPVFQVPDETSHVAYLQYFAETGLVPNVPGGDGISHEEAFVMNTVRFNDTIGNTAELAPFSDRQQEQLHAGGRAGLDRSTGGGIIETSGQPPLYYAVGALIYHASPWRELTQRITLIRFFSAFLAGLTTLFVFMFLRELFTDPWTWTLGALVVAFQPMFGFIAGGVHPDNLLFTASAALLFGLARAFRHGLTPAVGAGIGAALAVGLLAKLNFVALVPGALLALGLLLWRARDRQAAVRGAVVAVAMAGVAVGAYAVLNSLAWDRPLLGGGVENASAAATAGGAAPFDVRQQLGYTWQLYLPRLPFLLDQFAYFPPYEVWFRGMIGKFGWLDTQWPAWVYRVALGLSVPLVLLSGLALWRRRERLISRWPEVLVYAALTIAVMGSIGFLGIRFKYNTGFDFAQARYLFPFLAFYGAFAALAALGAGRRFARPLGVLLVLLAMSHGLLAQLLVISRFYG